MAATRAELAEVIVKRGDGVTRNEPARTTVPDGLLAALLAVDVAADDARTQIRAVLATYYPTRAFVAPAVHVLHKRLIAGAAR